MYKVVPETPLMVLDTKQKSQNKKRLIPNRVVLNPNGQKDGKETEIAAVISVPQEDKWRWLVIAASFLSIFLLNGICFTFGCLLPEISKEFNIIDPLVALINSTQLGLYFISTPLAASFVNRFGFRVSIMAGSVLCSFCLICSYFTNHYGSLYAFYGIGLGLGGALVNVTASLVVGFYFEKNRSLALAITTAGSSAGVMIMFPVNAVLVGLGGWRSTTLFHSGLVGIVFFLGMTFRPILSLTIIKTEDELTRPVTYLPYLRSLPKNSPASAIRPSWIERLLRAHSNVNFPTAAAVVEIEIPDEPSTSRKQSSKLTLIAHSSKSGISPSQAKQVHSIVTKTLKDPSKSKVEITIEAKKPRRLSYWTKIFRWEIHVDQSRPLYRDDAFYDGKIEYLPVYQRNVIEISPELRTGLEYQLAVSRAVTVNDLNDKRGVFNIAARRVLASMLDLAFLKRYSFLTFCISGCLAYVGFLVPFVYISDRNLKAGINDVHCIFFVSAIGLADGFGKLVFSSLAGKIDPIKLYAVSTTLGGISTIASNISYNLYYQYFYCIVYGCLMSCMSCLRSTIIVSLYGLDKLTNAIGIVLIFVGVGNIFSTPVAGSIKDLYGYSIAFYVSGIIITLSGIIAIPIRNISKRESR